MMLTANIQNAINVAARLHLGQIRKADGLPYIVHPFGVAWILANFTTDEEVIMAGLLHDVMEDVKGYSIDDLRKTFGERVAQIVKAASEDKDPNVESDEKATWADRKRKYIEHLRTADEAALLVSLADKVHNLQSLKAALKSQGSPIWDRFNASPDQTIWFYEQVLKVAMERLDNHELVSCFKAVLDSVVSI
jgi:(p)ppGpp synthase/HD superfamily hydrolase